MQSSTLKTGLSILLLGLAANLNASTVGRIPTIENENTASPPAPPANSKPVSVEKTSEVYRWKDANGKAHFSDAPPPEEYQADRIELEALPEKPANDEYSIVNQAKRLEDNRKEREKVRDEKRLKEQAEKNARAAARPANYDNNQSDNYDYGYGGYGGYPNYNIRHRRTGPSVYGPDKPLDTAEKYKRRDELPLYQMPRPRPKRPVNLPAPVRPASGSRVNIGR